jgi:ornithine carbamoyltransferase
MNFDVTNDSDAYIKGGTSSPSNYSETTNTFDSRKMSRQANRLFSLTNMSKKDIVTILATARAFKKDVASIMQMARGAILVLYFEKPSTRTRLSCTTAWAKLGGTMIDMSPQDGKTHINTNETIYDSFRVISEMCSCIVARVNDHTTLENIYRAANDSKKKPAVINGLSDKFHPLQALADLQTIHEHHRPHDDLIRKKTYMEEDFKQTTVCWIGDSNNVLNSLAIGIAKLGGILRICVPPKHPFKRYLIDALDALEKNQEIVSKSIIVCDTPVKALTGAHFIVTDTWVSMGDESEHEERLRNFDGYKITKQLIAQGQPDKHWKFMHCLPRKQNEVSDDIFYSDRSIVFQEAENRMWTALAVFYHVLCGQCHC